MDTIYRRGKIIIVLIAFLLTPTVLIWGQSCSRVRLDHRRELKWFINDSQKKGFFSKDKGVVSLTERLDTSGQMHWNVSVDLEDNYRRRAPSGWTRMFGRVILVNREAGMSFSKSRTPTSEELACSEKIVGDRVTKQPPPNPPEPLIRLGKPVLRPDGTPVMTTRRYMIGGGPGNSYHIIFYRNGEVSRLKSV